MKLLAMLGLTSNGNGGGKSAPRAVRRTAELCHKLLTERGESSGTRLAAEALAAYQELNAEGREHFFDVLVTGFSPDPEEAAAAGQAYRDDPSPENLERLRIAAQSPRVDLFQALNLAPGGTLAMVEMRGHLLKGSGTHPLWRAPADDLGHLFVSWFNRGFLELRRIDWDTSAAVLEKLIHYEAVHEIQGWVDLRRRLAADRRCYAFFHPALAGEPIVFIEAALTRGLATRIQPLLDPKEPVGNPDKADCAIFYSITNCHDGLRGVPFGSFLIKQVAQKLGEELPRLRRFATLSPAPGFRRWLMEHPDLPEVASDLRKQMQRRDWMEEDARLERFRKELPQLCAYYLLHAKRDGLPLDPVARFHLRNGAILERVNWMGNPSEAGIERSLGVMVNYEYRVGEVERNHERFSHGGEIAASSKVESLAALCTLAQEKRPQPAA